MERDFRERFLPFALREKGPGDEGTRTLYEFANRTIVMRPTTLPKANIPNSYRLLANHAATSRAWCS